MNLKDLIELKVLKDGDEIIWSRKSQGIFHIAQIVEGGKIMTADGVLHKTPSGAARHLNNNRPINGWIAWKIKSSRKDLDSFRKNV
jgi:hypothetical protein